MLKETEIRRIVAANVARARGRRGLTMTAAAAAAGVTQSFWSQIESADRCPKIPVLARMAESLGVRPATLLKGL